MSATRTDLEVTAKYFLKNAKNDEIILKEETKSISSFDVVESVYATIVAEKDAREKKELLKKKENKVELAKLRIEEQKNKNINIFFAGIDLVGGYLIGDINVTSPTGLPQYKN